jgi:enoyl-CoA hydratase/carnithine racemase
MTNAMRPSTIETLGLGSVLDIVKRGRLPADTGDLVDKVFGPSGRRGALVISGANGIVGAGKTMQLGSRLEAFGVPIVALDFPGVPDGIGKQYPGLVNAFGRERAAAVAANVIKLTYDGTSLPRQLGDLRPRFLLEAIPEILDVKRAHYDVFRAAFPSIEIRSVTSGFPQSQLGVGIAHPAFPHEINKLYETVEPEPSDITRLLWSLGLIPLPVSDNWSFVLDVLFCGITLAALRYCDASNMPYWKVDKYVRQLVGPNPLRAHDAIGAAGANFLTWSCLHHLGEEYGGLFEPTTTLDVRKDTGENWYPPDHFRPLVNWSMDQSESDEFMSWMLGPVFQMTSLMVQEKRSHLAQMNIIGELCAQFSRGVLAMIRSRGADSVIRTVETYHGLHPQSAEGAWFPDVFEQISTPEWQQLYVNAEHDGNVGVISIGRESYNSDVDAELNRAIDWLGSEGIDRVVVTSDFHLTTQLVGADTTEFYPALADAERGTAVSRDWSVTARRLNDEFGTSVGLINGKRCLGGMLELMLHCHYLVAADHADLGLPEVTLPVVPGMEGCHWPFRRTEAAHWPRLIALLLEGRPVKARDALGWITDYVGPLEESLQVAWAVASGGDHGLQRRKVVDEPIQGVTEAMPPLDEAGDPKMEEGRKAILDTVQAACGASLVEALEIQAKRSGAFMTSTACRDGVIGTTYRKTTVV